MSSHRSYANFAALRKHSFVFALLLASVLLIANIIVQPAFGAPSNWAVNLGIFAPLAVVAMASTPAIVSGGIDISVGPMTAVVNCIFVAWLLPHGLGAPEIAIPLLLAIGAALGAVNGFLVAVLRYQPVIATLCAFFVLSGLAATVSGSPTIAASSWMYQLAHGFGWFPGALLTIGAPLLLWLALQRTAFCRTLFAVGADDATAYSAGVNVVGVRVAAYVLGGLFAAVAGIALTALIASSDSGLATEYTLVALAAVTLGGTPIGGGRGGLIGPVFGAAAIFLLQELLSATHLSDNYLQLVYGALLVAGVVISSRVASATRGVAL